MFDVGATSELDAIANSTAGLRLTSVFSFLNDADVRSDRQGALRNTSAAYNYVLSASNAVQLSIVILLVILPCTLWALPNVFETSQRYTSIPEICIWPTVIVGVHPPLRPQFGMTNQRTFPSSHSPHTGLIAVKRPQLYLGVIVRSSRPRSVRMTERRNCEIIAKYMCNNIDITCNNFLYPWGYKLLREMRSARHQIESETLHRRNMMWISPHVTSHDVFVTN